MQHTPETVLVIEDDRECRDAVTDVLRHDGYRVVAVEDGLAALRFLEANPPPALVLLDMQMPAMDGWRFLEERRGRPAVAAIPTVILTGEREVPIDPTVAGRLHKPLDIDDLLAMVQSVVVSAPRPIASELPASSTPDRSVAAVLTGLRVLVVDDDPLLVRALAMLLVAAGAEPQIATSVPEAWQCFERSVPDAIVSDLRIAGDDGHSLIRLVRAHAPTRKLLAIALTGHVLPEDRERAIAAGFDCFVTKPVEIDQLTALLARLVTM
jgi:CheY-like chemotaxis protein